MISKINLEFFNNYQFQKKVILNFLDYLDNLRISSELVFVKTIHEESEYYYELQPLLNNIISLQNHFLKEMNILLDSYENFFSDFSMEINYKDKINLFKNLTETQKEINYMVTDIKLAQNEEDKIHLYDYEDIYNLFLSYINLIKVGFGKLDAICNLSETPSLYEPSLSFYENEFHNLSDSILSKLNRIKRINCLK